MQISESLNRQTQNNKYAVVQLETLWLLAIYCYSLVMVLKCSSNASKRWFHSRRCFLTRADTSSKGSVRIVRVSHCVLRSVSPARSNYLEVLGDRGCTNFEGSATSRLSRPPVLAWSGCYGVEPPLIF